MVWQMKMGYSTTWFQARDAERETEQLSELFAK